MSENIQISRAGLWGWLSAAALAIGSLGPWVTVGPFSKSGTSGDGVLTLIAAGIIAVGIAKERRKLVLAFAALSLAVGVYDVADVSSSGNELLSVGWGLIMVTAASISLLVWWWKAREMM